MATLTIAAPAPHNGPASPMRASSATFAGLPYKLTNAPIPGMNIGALADSP